MLKPMLISNDEINIHDIKYPQLASYKLDGMRMFIDKELLSRSLKLIPNKQVRNKFNFLKEYCIKNNIILDGELYCKEIPFQMIISCVMTDDYNSKNSIKAWSELCKEHSCFVSRLEALEYLKFYCFDCITNNNINDVFSNRITNYINHKNIINSNYFVAVEQWSLFSSCEVEKLFENAINNGYEGLILKNSDGRYKTGRTTVKENLGYKCKLFVTIDGKIIDVIQCTEVNDNTEKKINELGRSVTSKKQDDRHLIESASAFVVEYKGKDYKINLKMNDKEKEYVWKNKHEFIGKWVEYKCMELGMKTDGLPRHGKTNQDFETIRMRDDKT